LTRYAIVESTYGGTVRPDAHRSMEARLDRLHEVLQRALRPDRGIALMPCFAVGRTQDLLFDVHALFALYPDAYDGVDVILDAPMGSRVNRVYAELLDRRIHGRDHDGELAWLGEQSVAFFAEGARKRRKGHRDDRERAQWQAVDCLREMLVPGHRRRARGGGVAGSWRRLWRPAGKPRDIPKGRAIVLTGSGMCDGGPVQFYLRELAHDPHTTVIFNGWVHPQSVGGKLMQLAELEPVPGLPPPPPAIPRAALTDVVRLSDVEVPLSQLQLKIDRLYGYSAHADQRGLVEWLFPTVGEAEEARRATPAPNAPFDVSVATATGAAREGLAGDAAGAARVPLAQHVFITHGEPEPRRALAEAIHAEAERRGHVVTTHLPPEDGAWFDLDEGAWIE
jgi:metallo-beta-lactamase family protein